MADNSQTTTADKIARGDCGIHKFNVHDFCRNCGMPRTEALEAHVALLEKYTKRIDRLEAYVFGDRS